MFHLVHQVNRIEELNHIMLKVQNVLDLNPECVFHLLENTPLIQNLYLCLRFNDLA